VDVEFYFIFLIPEKHNQIPHSIEHEGHNSICCVWGQFALFEVDSLTIHYALSLFNIIMQIC
jgi:hypothetical protein